MATVITRDRTVAAPVEEVWALIEDFYMLPRWWPLVDRVENVDESGYTQVMRSSRGRNVRIDFTVADKQPGSTLVLDQAVEDTAFQKMFTALQITMHVERAGDQATAVRLRHELHLKGIQRFGGAAARRGPARILDEALDGLVRIFGAA